EKEDELYNEGSPFKITSRDTRGVIVTIIADNYFGYSKKEIKTQISYAANLSGLYEEEHAGGALAFASFNLGVHYSPDSIKYDNGQTFEEAIALLGDEVQVFPEGYAVHKQFPSIFILPENARLFVDTQEAQWQWQGKDQKMRILPGKVYVHPSGYKIHLEKHPATPAWRLVGTEAEGVFCHKPCTVSGGGKSEISKSIWDAIRFEPIFVADFESDMQEVAKILERSYDDRLDPSIPVEKMPAEAFPRFGASSESLSRPNGLLDPAISLGFVIHLLSPASIWCDAYNEWVNSIPNNIKMLVFLVKRFYRPSWGEDWQSHFSVNTVNGKPGNEIRYAGRNLIGSYLRIGSRGDGSGWTYKMRQDCMPAIKVQMEDDISASIVVPSSQLENLNPKYDNPSVKIAENCEHRLFQRPDDAIHRGYDKQAEQDLSLDGNFICNFAPLEQKDAIEMTELAVTFSNYTQPMQQLIAKMAEAPEQSYFVASSHPRIVDGEPSKNPRYLQLNPNLKQPRDRCLADLGARLSRRIPHGKPVYHPVNAVLPGRRNNPADPESGIRPLAVYNPIHYQELPELFMDFVASLTGKSPSTTGAGTEGALTKAPFNALVATSDLNNALLSYILTGYNAYTTAAGYIGRRFRIDHDVSLLIPELWCRMSPQELDPQRLISLGYLEPIEDFEYQGRLVPASRLGYRITHEFCNAYFGRVFDHPETIFHKEMLRPELQSLEDFVDGIENIVEAQQKVARAYLADGSVEAAIPPLKALLHIMAEGSYEGKTVHNPEIRSLFTRDYVIRSEWYAERLRKQQEQHISHCEHHITYLNGFLAHSHNLEKELQQEMKSRLKKAQQDLDRYKQKDYLNSLVGTLGLDPLFR
ncbi:MAG: hypothetical protein D6B26_07285, partial [Spirochaetaceae bacterium]